MKIRYYLILLICLLFPVVLIIMMSRNELKINLASSDINVVQMAYGEAVAVHYGDIQEIVLTHGIVTARSYVELEVDSGLANDVNRLEIGREFTADESIISSDQYELRAPVNSLLEEVHHSSNGRMSIVLLNLDQLSLDLFFADKFDLDPALTYQLYIDHRSYDLTHAKLSNVYTEKGYKVQFDIVEAEPDLLFQQAVSGVFMTGRKESSTLKVPVSSVYKSTLNGMPAVRVVSEYGVFIEEHAVNIGIQDLDDVAVTGLNEGVFIDDGAARVYGYLSSGGGD